MRDHGDRAARMGRGRVGQRPDKAACVGLIGLRPRDLPVLRIVVKGFDLLGRKGLRIAEGDVLPVAQRHLAQPGLCLDRKTLWPADRLCGQHGAVEIRGVDGVDRDRSKAPLQRPDLPKTVAGDPRVVVPVDPAIDVSLRLCMADHVEFCHFTAP